jgi:cell division protein FtsZ
MPFSFEGKRRLTQAEDSLKQLQNRTDALILFENNRMGELSLPKDGIQKAFVQADQLIAQSLRAVSTIVTTPGLVKLGIDDLTSALSTSNGRCLFGFGEARGQNRGSEALKRALKSPLIDQGRLLHQTKTLLVHIAGGDSLTLVEVDSIMKQLGKNVPDQTHILFGVAVDPKLGESISVTLISSLGLTQLNTLAAAAPPSEMLPLKERAMPSMLSAVAAKPAPQLKHVPAAEPMDMLFGNDQFSLPEPQAAVVEQPDMFEQESFASEPEPVVNAEEIPFEEEIFEEVAETEVAEQVSHQIPEPEPEPVKPIVRPRIEDFIPNSTARSNTNLTAVVARAPTPTVEEEAPFAPPLNSVAAKKPLVSTQEEQIAFRFGGDEDRGRFKNTEPALAGGEDLDVPTWMRLKRKLKK